MSNDPLAQFSLALPKFPEAVCSGNLFHPDTWFPESIRNWDQRDAQSAVAKSFCKQCVHRVECLQFAVENGISDGIWGGMLPEERNTAPTTQGEVNRRQIKLDTVRDLVAKGFALIQACREVGISEGTFQRYVHFEKAGWPKGLTPKQRREKENK